MRGKGWRPSMASSSAVSSPYRYSPGPSNTSSSTPATNSAARNSSTAIRSRLTSVRKERLRAKMTLSAPTARAATRAPSTTW